MSRRRQIIAAAVILALLAVRDFASRVYVGRDEELRRFAVPSLPEPPPAPDAAAHRAQLLAWLPELGVGAPQAAADPDDPKAWDLRLVGTFRERSQHFAVIMALPRGGGPSRKHRLAVGDQVLGRTVTRIDSGSVTLAADGGLHELRVFERKQR